MAEIIPAIGARAQLLYAPETSWGTIAATPAWRQLRLIGGESLDQNLAIYNSREIRSDRMRNNDVRGTQRPGGSIPFELSPQGWLPFFYHLLGGSVVTTGTGPYTHTLKGSTSLPVGFTLEKGFTDISQYFPFYGCRVDRVSLNFGIDQPISGSFDILAQQSAAASATSLNIGSAPTLPTDDPYTGVQVVVQEGSSLTTIATAESATLEIANHYFTDRGFTLGSNLRQYLRPGTRMTSLSGRFVFNDVSLYNKAIAGTATKIKLIATSGAYSATFSMPSFQFIPNGSLPKIPDDGPLSIDLRGNATKDSGISSEIQAIFVAPEADITI